ncbi:uncharacterized protein YgbK (DUF1537 family) [Ochrobactrum daejeonense]|uniref:Uncharacterized protein YgbK (DUF1537 family) n=1 Tax=Brucella daejeonensis TaxID=659015 RepID=A0A7W9AVB7_9HYPH|nr:four-carbon acid sugar kinase family protein [Brucella daejeonensis]MBB5701255.1 uncharacterized protein YgbK (DUF1537 family) [Brucella daejeonensis]
MKHRWLVIADDLTGAADCAMGFARFGLTAAVGWGTNWEENRDTRPPVFSYDADSRALSAVAAAFRHRQILAHQLDDHRLLFKKIDSTLRGQPAAEMAATLETLSAHGRRAFGILAPAFPSVGRSTLNGRIVVSGRSLEETEIWKRDHSYRNADLIDVLASAGIKAELVGIDAVRAGGKTLASAMEQVARSGAAIAVCDAEIDDDLMNIAGASIVLDPAPFFIGSAGLAYALATLEDRTERPSPPLEPTSNGMLLVVGSVAAVSRASARKLVTSRSISHIPVEPAILLADNPAARLALGRDVANRLAAGEDLLVEIVANDDPDKTLGAALAAGLAEALAPTANCMGAFAATGGETAAALLSRFGVNGILLVDEIEPGIALGLTRGKISIPIATKAGAFGNEDSLGHIASRLKFVSTEGRFS